MGLEAGGQVGKTQLRYAKFRGPEKARTDYSIHTQPFHRRALAAR
jgi:hypothetical protein